MATQITSVESSRKRSDKGAVYQSKCSGSELPNSNEDTVTECGACHERLSPPSNEEKEEWLACHNCETWYHCPVQESSQIKIFHIIISVVIVKIIKLVVVYDK